MIRMGGRWIKKGGGVAGEGMKFHFKRLQELLWPTEKVWHKWNIMQMECYLDNSITVVMGAASTGKTNSAATDVLADYFCYPECTTVICCSTTKERLEDRIMGEFKKYFRLAKDRCNWLPGHLIEGRQRIVTDSRAEAAEGRDFRNGIIGVAALKGNSYVGLSSFIGIKNKRVRLLADELSLLPRAFIDSISNLDKNPSFKCIGLGNPKDTTDAMGVLGEPAAHLGGWDGGIDQTPQTKTWPTRRIGGICLQLPGPDSPNLDGKLGIPLITQEQIDRDVAYYGTDSIQYTMMNLASMPRGQGSRRVITRQMCQKFHALDDPAWKDARRTQIAFLDAAYGGAGGDRCVFGWLQFGIEALPLDGSMHVSNLISQDQPSLAERQILHLGGMELVPIVNNDEPAEDQIVDFVRSRCEQQGVSPENFWFDAGMRTSLVSAFSRKWSSNVQSIDFGGRPSDRKVSTEIDVFCKDYYSKFVTELWFNVRHVIEANQFRGMTEDVMMEGSSREWKIVGANKIEVETKAEMKLKTSRSPDLFDALACGVHGAIQRGFKIQRLGTPQQKRQDSRWKRELKEQQEKLWQSKQLNYAA